MVPDPRSSQFRDNPRRCYAEGMKYLTMLLALPLTLSAACQNNTVELELDSEAPVGSNDGTADDTTGAMADSSDVDVDTGPPPPPGIAGNWLLAASTPLDPSLPFQFLVLAEEVGPDTFNLTLTPLSLDVGSTTAPRQPVGEPKILFGVPLTIDAGFDIYTGPMVIPGAANPISATEVTVDILLSGMPGGNPYCGNVSGSVTAPAPQDLAGSTFGTEKVNGVDSLPTTFATSC